MRGALGALSWSSHSLMLRLKLQSEKRLPTGVNPSRAITVFSSGRAPLIFMLMLKLQSLKLFGGCPATDCPRMSVNEADGPESH